MRGHQFYLVVRCAAWLDSKNLRRERGHTADLKEMQEVATRTADQEGATEQDDVFEDALESVIGLLDVTQDSKVKTRQVTTFQLQNTPG